MNHSFVIIQILQAKLSVSLSWGRSKTVPIYNGLKIYINGFLHTGWVSITYNEGTDLFDVDIVGVNGEILKLRKGFI